MAGYARARNLSNPLPTTQLEILRYALSEMERTLVLGKETPSIIYVMCQIRERVTELEFEVAREPSPTTEP